jgi:uncharacterized protein (TIGR03066 family)
MEKSTRSERRERINGRDSEDSFDLMDSTASAAAVKPSKRKRPSLLLFLFLAVCLVGSSIASYFYFTNVAVSIPRELAGTWQVNDGPFKGSTLDFRLDGTAIATHHERGQKLTQQQSVKVEGNKIILTGKDEFTGKADTVIQTIVKLTDDELVIRDEDRRVYRMVRVR